MMPNLSKAIMEIRDIRVNYDPESWKAIAAQLNNDHEVIEAYRHNYMYYLMFLFTSSTGHKLFIK